MPEAYLTTFVKPVLVSTFYFNEPTSTSVKINQIKHVIVPELKKGKYEYMIHHVASIVLYRGLLLTGGPMIRFVPHFMICEFSNAIFNTAWFIRNGGGNGSLILRVLEMLFAIVFFILRIINLPISVYIMWNLPGIDELGWYRYVLLPILGLQYMWFYMIIVALLKKMGFNKPATKIK